MDTRKLLIALAILGIVLPVISGCAPPEEQLATTLNIRLQSDPPTLDPPMGWGTVSTNLFLSLTDLDVSYELTPHLATDWEASDDGLVWTFHLRDDVYWVHYDPQTKAAEKKRKLTAHDVEYSVKRTIDPTTGCDYAHMDYIIKNAYAVNSGDESVSLDSVGVVALDDHTVQFTLEHPAGYFPYIAGVPMNWPVPREVIEEFGDVWAEPGNLWTCGPFMLDTWSHDDRIVLVKNPHYYDAGNVTIETVNYVMVEAASTVFQMYQAGELDTSIIPLSDLEWVRAHPELSKELHVESALGTGYMMFNVSKPPVDNPLVRKALAAATDKQAMVDNVLRGGEIPAKSFSPPGVFGSPAEDPNFKGIPFDPQQAREWLAEAGYPDGKGFPEVVLMYTSTEGNRMLGEFVQQQWKEHLGIELKMLGQEWKVFLQTLREDPPHVWGLGWFADYPDANNFVLDVCHPTKGGNGARWNAEDPAAQRFMEVTEAAAAESDPRKRKALYFEAETILVEDEAIMIPLWYVVERFLTKPYVERNYSRLRAGFATWRVRAH